MRRLLVLVPFLFAACSGASEDEAAQDEDALSTKTIAVDRDLPLGFDKDFDRTFSTSLVRDGRRIDGALGARVHFDVNGAKLVGTVTVGKRLGQPHVLRADLKAKLQYTASLDADLDVRGTGTTDLIRAHQNEWQRLPFGGAALPVVSNIMPLDIPLQGPLFVHTHFDLGVACELLEIEGNAHLKTGGGVRGGVEVAVRYDRDHFGQPDRPGIPDNRFRFEAGAPDFEAIHQPARFTGEASHVKARCGVQPTLVVLLERTVGAKIIVEPYVDVEATKSGEPAAWRFSMDGAGVEGYVQTDVEIFGRALPGAKQFPLFDRKL